MSKTKLLRGEEVLNSINTSSFVTNWKKLGVLTPGFTRLQEPEFVITWYSQYDAAYEPVVAIAREADDTPTALMCLAWEKNSGTLTHAGHKNAEYHGWLAKPEIASTFLVETIGLLQQQFGLKKWNWGWMPPGSTPILFNNLKTLGITVKLEKRPSLIWDLTIPEKLQKVKKSRSLKSKFKRLQKRGDLKFRVITSEKEVAEILTTVKYHCDFRMEAIYDIRPFGDDPNKIAFNAALLGHPGTLHASGLWLDNKLLAFHLGICDEKRVCLGTSSYDPSESKYSPGTLLMVKLAEKLTEQGYEIFDLTPGTDSYKERYANDTQKLYRPSFYFSTKSVIAGGMKHFLVECLKKILAFLRIDIQWAKYWADKFKDIKKKASHIGLLKIISQSLKGVYNVRKMVVYNINPSFKDISFLEQTIVNFQQYEDLMCYKNLKPWQTRRDLLKESLFKFSNGESLLSATKNNELCWSCWHTFSQNLLSVRGFSKKIELEKDGYVLHDFYCPDITSFSQYFEKSLISLKDKGIPVYFILDSSIIISKDKITLWDIKLTKKLICVQILWIFKFIREKKVT